MHADAAAAGKGGGVGGHDHTQALKALNETQTAALRAAGCRHTARPASGRFPGETPGPEQRWAALGVLSSRLSGPPRAQHQAEDLPTSLTSATLTSEFNSRTFRQTRSPEPCRCGGHGKCERHSTPGRNFSGSLRFPILAALCLILARVDNSKRPHPGRCLAPGARHSCGKLVPPPNRTSTV